VIKNLSYKEYKRTIGRAKWAVTFGEGLDGYFVETIFSGGISFAVYNDHFFPDEFKQLPTVFESYQEMELALPTMLEQLDDEPIYSNFASS